MSSTIQRSTVFGVHDLSKLALRCSVLMTASLLEAAGDVVADSSICVSLIYSAIAGFASGYGAGLITY
jgi:hypothetical protein